LSPPEDRENEDDRLVGAAQDGDVRAFEALLLRHEGMVLRLVRFLGVPAPDREDVAQEVFIRVFRHLGRVDRSRPFSGWLYRVTVNAVQDYRARAARRGAEEAPWSEAVEVLAQAPGGDPEEHAGQAALRRRLETALARLSERERAVFVLREIEGLETREVAWALGVSSITVRRHLGLARDRLRSLLRDERKDPRH